jgi:uncharacterized RDD family membrane protein YckC
MIAARFSRKEQAAVSTPNNYAPPQSVVADISSTDVPFEKATRLSRLLAVIIDAVLFSIPFIPLYTAVISAGIHSRAHPQAFMAAWLGAMAGAGIFLYIGGLVYLALIIVTIVLVHRNAQTIGKKLVGIKVARKDGSRASLARIFWMRNVLNSLVGIVLLIVPFIGGFYSLIDAVMIFGEQRRCCHDYIADTIVIRA